MPDIVRTIYPLSESIPDNRGISRVVRRDLSQDSRKHRQQGTPQKPPRQHEHTAQLEQDFAALLDEPQAAMPPGIENSVLQAIFSRNPAIDFVVTENGEAIELRSAATQHVLLELPAENVHELSGDGLLVSGVY